MQKAHWGTMSNAVHCSPLMKGWVEFTDKFCGFFLLALMKSFVFPLLSGLSPSSLLDIWTGLPLAVLSGLGKAGAGHSPCPAGSTGGAGDQRGAGSPGAAEPHQWAFTGEILSNKSRVHVFTGKLATRGLYLLPLLPNPHFSWLYYIKKSLLIKIS